MVGDLRVTPFEGPAAARASARRGGARGLGGRGGGRGLLRGGLRRGGVGGRRLRGGLGRRLGRRSRSGVSAGIVAVTSGAAVSAGAVRDHRGRALGRARRLRILRGRGRAEDGGEDRRSGQRDDEDAAHHRARRRLEVGGKGALRVHVEGEWRGLKRRNAAGLPLRVGMRGVLLESIAGFWRWGSDPIRRQAQSLVEVEVPRYVPFAACSSCVRATLDDAETIVETVQLGFASFRAWAGPAFDPPPAALELAADPRGARAALDLGAAGALGRRAGRPRGGHPGARARGAAAGHPGPGPPVDAVRAPAVVGQRARRGG